MASGDERPVKRQKVNDHQGGGGGGWKMKGKRKVSEIESFANAFAAS